MKWTEALGQLAAGMMTKRYDAELQDWSEERRYDRSERAKEAEAERERDKRNEEASAAFNPHMRVQMWAAKHTTGGMWPHLVDLEQDED